MTGHTRQPTPAAGPPDDPPGTSYTRPPQLPRRSGPGMAPAPSHGGSSRRRQQARKLYAHTHTPAGQRNAGPSAQAAHDRPAQQKKRATIHRATYPPRGPQCQEEHRPNHQQNLNARAQATPDRRRFNTQRTHAGIKTPAPAREKVLRARLRPLRVATPKIFVGLGPKNHFPQPWAAYKRGSKKRQGLKNRGGRYKKIPRSCTVGRLEVAAFKKF